MKVISTDDRLPQLVRLDRKTPNGYVLVTYKISDNQFTTYRDNKAIGWASTLALAMWTHEMYLAVYRERYH